MPRLALVIPEVVAANAGGLTSVSTSWSTSWDVNASVSDSWQTSWNVNATISDSWQTSWNVRQAVSDSWQTTWNVIGTVSDTWQTSWHVRATISDSWQTSWHILTGVSDSWSTSWNVRQSISDSWQTSWNVRQSVTDSWQTSWHVLSAVTDSWQTSWHVNATITDSWQTLWNIAASTYPKISTLQVNFNSIDLAVWNSSGSPAPDIDNGQLRLQAQNGYPGLETDNWYDLHDSSVFVQVPTVPTSQASGAQPQTYFILTNESGHRVQVSFTGHPTAPYWLLREEYAGPTYSDTTVAYDAINHKWMRIREAAGTLYIDASADGLTWSNLRTWARTAVFDKVKLTLGAGTSTGAALGITTYAYFDNVNLAGGVTGWENNDPWNNSDPWDSHSGLTNIVDAWSTVWHVRQTVLDTWSTSWNVNVTETLTSVTDNWTTYWNLVGQVTDNWPTLWHIFSDETPQPPVGWTEDPLPSGSVYNEESVNTSSYELETVGASSYNEESYGTASYNVETAPSNTWTEHVS